MAQFHTFLSFYQTIAFCVEKVGSKQMMKSALENPGSSPGEIDIGTNSGSNIAPLSESNLTVRCKTLNFHLLFPPLILRFNTIPCAMDYAS